MKKIYIFAFGLAVAISFWGIRSLPPLFRANPAAVAETGFDPAAARVEVRRASAPAGVNAVFPTPTAPPTITPAAPSQASAPAAANTPAAPQYYPAQSSADTQAAAAQAAPAYNQNAVSSTDLVGLNQLIAQVSSGQPGVVAGVFVPGKLSLPVLQQPAGNTSYVSTQPGVVTQFGTTNVYGTIGLLAHNYLSGANFFQLSQGDNVYVIYGDGRTEQYAVTRIDRFQALSPSDIYSNFINLNEPGSATLSSTQVFYQEYGNGNQVVFQTCIEANGDSSWGRIFITADKIAGS